MKHVLAAAALTIPDSSWDGKLTPFYIGLRCHYLQKKKDRFEHGNVPSSYLEVSSLLASFKGIVYNTTTDWRKNKTVPPFRVVKLSFNNLSRTLRIEQLMNYQYVAEPTKRTIQQVGQDLNMPGLRVGPSRPAGYTGRPSRNRCDSCMVVGILLAVRSIALESNGFPG